MFSFEENKNKIIEAGIIRDEARDKYPDKYMAIANARIENTKIVGDIIAFFTIEEYNKTEFKENLVKSKFEIWAGWDVIDTVGRLSFYA